MRQAQEDMERLIAKMSEKEKELMQLRDQVLQIPVLQKQMKGLFCSFALSFATHLYRCRERSQAEAAGWQRGQRQESIDAAVRIISLFCRQKPRFARLNSSCKPCACYSR